MQHQAGGMHLGSAWQNACDGDVILAAVAREQHGEGCQQAVVQLLLGVASSPALQLTCEVGGDLKLSLHACGCVWLGRALPLREGLETRHAGAVALPEVSRFPPAPEGYEEQTSLCLHD